MLFNIAVIFFTSISITNALDVIPSLPIPMPMPGLDLPKIPCLSSVSNAGTCATDLISAVLSVEMGSIKPSCCEAVLKVEDSCWGMVFPTNPLIPVAIKSVCGWVRDHPLAPSPPLPPPTPSADGVSHLFDNNMI